MKKLTNENLYISKIVKKDEEIDRLRVQLAGCSVVALGGISKEQIAKEGDYGWSSTYQDVLDLRLKYESSKGLNYEKITS